VLIIYPERELRPAGPLGDLADGAAWYARRSRAPLYAVATRVLSRGHQAPEAYLSSARVEDSGSVRDVTHRLAGSLARELSDLDSLTTSSDPRQPLPGFRQAVRGRRSWEERIDAVARWRR
jgi:hypothetical protein